MPASPWDMSNWYNWYWWLPSDKVDEDIPKDESPIEKENIDSIEEEIFPKEEVTQEATLKEKPKRKKRTYTKKTKTQDAIELVLRPTILEELEKEAIITDSTINQVIQVILESHIESKSEPIIESNLQTEVWKCNDCTPVKEFRDYFEFSEHFFSEHMQPGLQKIENFRKEQ